MPSAGSHVWKWFRELDRARPGTGYGINPISWHELDAWSRRRKVDPSQWEVDAIMALDAVRMELYYEKQNSENNGRPEVNDRELSPGLFDALFKA
ncbi:MULTISPECIES: phage tail assembly chaperone [Rhizobium/Agrobacterium group]|uniref:phage tail assembly chaperone n=1 Tax=Rhizobium oryzihabitans TaxID=2267833 RepID=UPI0040337B8C